MNRRPLLWEMMAACAVALLLASGALTAFQQAGSTRPALAPGARQIWTATGDVTYSSISPDGRFVAFVRPEPNQSRSLVIHDVIDGSDLRLTDAESTGSPGRAVFSPDSKRVAFNWTNAGLDEIRAVDLGSLHTQRASRIVRQQADTPSIWPGDWSSDGKWIAAIALRRDRTGQIALISLDDGSMHSLKSVDFGRLWSFDSSHLYFSPTADIWPTVASNPAAGLLRCGSSPWTEVVKPRPWCSRRTINRRDGRQMVRDYCSCGIEIALSAYGSSPSKTADPRAIRNRSVKLWAEPGYHTWVRREMGTCNFSSASRETRIAIAGFDFRSGKISVKEEVHGGMQQDWSPNGRSLAYKSAKGPSDPSGHTLTIQPFGRGPNRVLRPRLLTWNWPRWSPDQRAFRPRYRRKRTPGHPSN